MRPPLVSQKPETSCRNGYIACSLLHRHTDILCSCWAHGAVVLSPMMPTVLLSIFGRLWKTILVEHSPTSSLPSPIGRRRGNFLGLFVTFLLQMTYERRDS